LLETRFCIEVYVLRLRQIAYKETDRQHVDDSDRNGNVKRHSPGANIANGTSDQWTEGKCYAFRAGCNSLVYRTVLERGCIGYNADPNRSAEQGRSIGSMRPAYMLPPANSPAQAKPLIALPNMKSIDVGAEAEMAEPMVKPAKESRKIVFIG
jgi:hypothetical protein